MQKVCGACQLQFIDYDYQLQIKREIVKDTLHSIGGIDIEIPFPIKSPEIKEYRCKVQYPIGQTKVSKKILAGYYKQKSHEIVNIKYCPIQPRICDDIINFIREKAFEFGVSGYNEKKHIGDLRHVVIRHSEATNKNLVILVINAKKSFKKIENLANEIYSNFKEVSGVCLNFNPNKSNLILTDSSKSKCTFQSFSVPNTKGISMPLLVSSSETCDCTSRIGAQSFPATLLQDFFHEALSQAKKKGISKSLFSRINSAGLVSTLLSVENQ